MIQLKLLACVATFALFGSGALAQPRSYPDKPVKIVVPYPAGVGPDVVARIYAEKLQKEFGQPFVIDNRPGAGGLIGTENVASSPPDGYTILLAVKANMAIAPHVYKKTDLAPNARFRPISQVLTLPHIITTYPSAPFSNLSELIALAKKQPNRWNYASLGVGAQSHVAMAAWWRQFDVQINHIPYKNNPATDLMAQVVDLSLEGSGSAMPLLRAGKIKAIAVSGSTRIPELPNVQTVSEFKPGADEDGVIGNTWHGFFAPIGTPDAVINALSSRIVKITAMPDVREKIMILNATPTGTTPDQLAHVVEKDYESLGKIIREFGITND